MVANLSFPLPSSSLSSSSSSFFFFLNIHTEALCLTTVVENQYHLQWNIYNDRMKNWIHFLDCSRTVCNFAQVPLPIPPSSLSRESFWKHSSCPFTYVLEGCLPKQRAWLQLLKIQRGTSRRICVRAASEGAGGLGPHRGAEDSSSHLKEERQVSKIRESVGLELCSTTPIMMSYLGADLQGTVFSPILGLAVTPPLQVTLIRAVSLTAPGLTLCLLSLRSQRQRVLLGLPCITLQASHAYLC